ncbi:MAG: valine--tRNA ligase [Candidatus Omnitrophica bacterium]|nr:valine--tRNA ligase [Candidatus Omnitrophota bacterium]
MNEIPSRYNPQEVEDRWYQYWQEQKNFSAAPNPAKKPFCIVIPPPNVTGILHMGHALNNTIQDILIRYHRMKGEESLWMPGTDHAGIATQNVVEKSIAKEGLKRQDLGREKFIERVWQWREQYGSTIIHQLKKLGSSCAWERLRFTMDDEYSKAVLEVFVRLYEQGLIYQGNYIINWCPRCQTALADEEAPHRDLQGNLYYIKYPVKKLPVSGSQSSARNKNKKQKTADYIVVATTRPETMLGDTAVAVNPKDRRFKHLIGATLTLPLINREIKIIADSSVDIKFGTGAVKVTPSHDPNDYALGKKHNLDFITVMSADGRMNVSAGEYQGMDRFEAREVILEDLKEQGLLEKVEAHAMSAGHCYRCHTIIEPYLSKQWFVKMKPLAAPALEAVKKGTITFYPKRWMKVYIHWMEQIQDWCISRQIWWGHRIPVYYCKQCQEAGISDSRIKDQNANINPGVIVSRVKPETCPHCGSAEITQDEDVLDTWFSSWLWPFATFYWPFESSDAHNVAQQQNDLKYFYPTSVLVTAPEIIFFWVARMIMAGFAFMGAAPFKDVYIHGTVRDIEGKKMSKSLGNIIDPLEIIKEYGTDALRFSLISITAQGQDVFLSKERFEQGRNFANKIWNAARFISMNLNPQQVRVDLCEYYQAQTLSLTNRWILSRFYSTLQETQKRLDAYKFNEAANNLYSFFWHEFCDWYLEMIKGDIAAGENQVVMYKVLEKFLRVLHPCMPFITEELWQRLYALAQHADVEPTSITRQTWPHVQTQIIDKKLEQSMQLLFDCVTAIRNMRLELEIPLSDVVAVRICLANKNKRAFLQTFEASIRSLAKVGTLSFVDHYERSPGEFANVVADAHVVISLPGEREIEKLKIKTEANIFKTKSEIKAKKAMLANEHFLKRAPAEVVAKEQERLQQLEDTLKKLEVMHDGFR